MNKQTFHIPLITEIQRYCLQDGPGIRTTVFVKGCPLHCPWCHNPETQNPKQEFYYYKDKCTQCGRCVSVCPTQSSALVIGKDKIPLIKIDRSTCIGCMKCVHACLSGARAVVGNQLTMEQILAEAKADQMFFKNSGGGVTISGGDPLLFPRFSLELSKQLKKEGFHVAMETTCFSKWDVIEPLLNSVDLFIVDIKTLVPEKHEAVIGWPLAHVLKNIENLIASNANVRIHLPIIPEFNYSSQDFEAYFRYLSPIAEQVAGVDILPFHVFGAGKYEFLGRNESYAYKNAKEISPKAVISLGKALKESGISQVSIGGLVGMGREKGEIFQSHSERNRAETCPAI